MNVSSEDLRRYIEELFEEKSYAVDDVDENDYRRTLALEAFDALVKRAERESELLARIQQLEERAAQAAELVAKAVGMMSPPKSERD
jgi:polyhydroxyalkanoate synthesis regulator phasin